MRRTLLLPSLVRSFVVIVASGLFITLLLLASGTPQKSYAATLDDPSPTVAPNPTQTAQPIQQSSSTANCPGVDINDKAPAITVCSPRFRGDAEGPAGTHITLLGRNFPSPPSAFYLLQVPSNLKAPPPVTIHDNTCLPAGNFKCFPVQDMQSQLSQIQNTQNFTLNFDWKFSIMEEKKDYFIILSYLLHNDKNDPQTIPVVSNISFTLLSPKAPCIMISLTPHPELGCSLTNSTPQLSAGSKIYIHGENWYPGNVQVVHIQLNTCQPSCQAGKFLPLTDEKPDSNGAFTSKAVTLNKDWNGYQLTANNSVPKNVTPQQHIQMQADNTLTFGHTEKGEPALSLNIVQRGSSDSPLLPMLALVPVLLSLLLYIIGQRRRNNLSTVATQRISATHGSRSQPLPPVSRQYPNRHR